MTETPTDNPMTARASENSDQLDALIDAQAAAELLDVPKTWVLAQARAERIPHVRLGRYVRFEPKQLRRWWARRRRGPGNEPWPR
jgi:excisionase family DNA binding protein